MNPETKVMMLFFLAVLLSTLAAFCLETADPHQPFRWKPFIGLSVLIWGSIAALGYLAICECLLP